MLYLGIDLLLLVERVRGVGNRPSAVLFLLQ
jgi:hypothetical protein